MYSTQTVNKTSKNEHLDNLTLKTQLECISINAGLLHLSKISSTFMPLTTDGQRAILLMPKLHETNMTFKLNTR